MIRAFVDGLRINALEEMRAVGWACDTEDPTHRLEVHATIGDRVVGTAICDRSRPDLLAHRLGDGHSGFVMNLDRDLKSADLDFLEIAVRRQDSTSWIAVADRKVNGRWTCVRPSRNEALAALWSEFEDRPGREGDHPVFIMGPARSGTSAIQQCLAMATRYRGFFEGHVLDLAAKLTTVVQEHYSAKLARIPNPDFYHLEVVTESHAQAAVRDMVRQLASGYKTLYWTDKTPTPEMPRAAPVLAQTWPSARFIFMKRRGIENVASRLRKFRKASFQFDATDWAATMSAWRAVRGSLQGRAIELEQLEMLRLPEETARTIGEFLALSEGEILALGESLRRDRPEMTDPTARVFGSIEETGWTADQIALFRTICHEEMAAYGYTYDGRYFEPSQATASPPGQV